MQIIMDKYALPEVKSALKDYNPDVAPLSSGSFFIKTDDGALIAVLVTKEKDRLYALQSQLFELTILTEAEDKHYVYLIVILNNGDTLSQLQLLSIQELGVFTLVSAQPNSITDIRTLVEFASDPGRRKEKKLLPSRNVRFFSPGEQMIIATPSIGPEKLRILLKHFGGSVAWVLAKLSSYDLLNEGLKSISANDISNFREAIGIDDGMILTIDSSEESHE